MLSTGALRLMKNGTISRHLSPPFDAEREVAALPSSTCGITIDFPWIPSE